jgi:ribosomal protein S21
MYKDRRSSKRYSPRDFVIPGKPSGVKIPDASSHALEKGLRVFKRQQKDSGVLVEARERAEYTKPTTARRKQKNDAVRRQSLEHKKEVAFWEDTAWVTMIDGKAV